jgi:hypothetical protein
MVQDEPKGMETLAQINKEGLMLSRRIRSWVLNSVAHTVDKLCVATGHRWCHRLGGVAFGLWQRVDKLEEANEARTS